MVLSNYCTSRSRLSRGSVPTRWCAVLNSKVYENISPQTLACWFMEGGGMNGSHSHGLQFHTQGFSHFEVNKLCEVLNSRYKFNAWMGVNKSKPVINIPANQYERFIEGAVNISMIV